MDSELVIYIDRLHQGKKYELNIVVDSSFMEIEEGFLVIGDKITIVGSCYLVEQEVHLCFTIKAPYKVPCKICNEWVAEELYIEQLHHQMPLTDIQGPSFDFSQIIREALLIEVSNFSECNHQQGKCKYREEVKHYFSSSNDSETRSSIRENKPFERL